MSSTFSRTTRSLFYDGSRRRTGKLLVALALLAVWMLWFLMGNVEVHEVTENARLEVSSLARPIVSVVDGQVVQTNLELGTLVEPNAVLVQLDDRVEQLALAESQSRLDDLMGQIQAIGQEIKTEEAADRFNPFAPCG